METYTIENKKLKATVTNLGATLMKLIDKESGIDVVLGYEDPREYLAHSGNLGATVGRNANRIGNASFKLNGEEYRLTVNDNMNQLHGGNGFAFKEFEYVSSSEDEITFRYFSKDLEEGFPGNLTLTVNYRLVDDSLVIGFKGISDEDTIFNITNHSYFNLGDDTVLDEEVLITTDKYSPTDEYSLTLDEVLKVDGTPYDFREYQKINHNGFMSLNHGIDNNYVWENLDDKLMASLRNDRLVLNVYSDLPDMHLYTAYYLKDITGKYGVPYVPYKGVCFEAQYYPNGINYENYLKPILKKDSEVSHYIRYEIKKRI